MAEEVFVALSNEEQRKYRSELLLVQSDVLKLIQRLNVLNQIRKEKTEYRIKISREYNIFLEGLKKFSEKMPNPKMPKVTLLKEKTEKVEKIISEDFEEEKIDSVEEELKEIQRQLKLLNGTN